MSQFSKSISLIIFVVCCFSISRGEYVEIATRKVQSNGQKVADLFSVRHDGSLIYLTHDKKVREFIDGQVHIASLSGPEISYPIKIKLNENRTLRYPYPVSVNRDIVIVVIETDDQGIEFVSIVALDPVSGAVFKLDLPSDLLLYNQYVGVIDDNSKINVVVRDHSICDGWPLCKLTFNNRGQLEQPLTNFPYNIFKLDDISTMIGSGGKGDFIIQNTNPEQTNVQSIYIDPRGNATNVHTFVVHNKYASRMFSSKADLFGYCLVQGRELDCMQYDSKSNTTVAIKFSANSLDKENADSLIVSFGNFERSKFLFAFLECGKKGESGCKTAKVATVNSEGVLLETMLISDEIECPFFQYVSSSIAEIGNQFCFYFVCAVKDYSYESALIQTKCIPKSPL